MYKDIFKAYSAKPDFNVTFISNNVEIKEPCDPYQSYELRGYQHELVKLARQGKNVIICAPPGNNKYFVSFTSLKR